MAACFEHSNMHLHTGRKFLKRSATQLPSNYYLVIADNYTNVTHSAAPLCRISRLMRANCMMRTASAQLLVASHMNGMSLRKLTFC
jgi:hypothetical protein